MNIIQVTEANITEEHICCVLADKKGESCVSSKKAWMRERFADGLVFKRLDARGKAFIEYIPAEKAWYPIQAEGYMHINCFWVSGQFKGQGHGARLLEECITDAKAQGKHGLTILSSAKKLPFLSEGSYLKKKGFVIADQAAPYFELLYLPFMGPGEAPLPRFKEHAKRAQAEEGSGVLLYYTNQCPYTDKYVPLIQELALERGIPCKLVKIKSAEQAQDSPAPFTTYSLFYNGKFVTHEILTEKKFLAVLAEN
ncbi:MAG: acetyltransferase family [Paenibacillaceae bacterium]|jgi:ribosomal protein S18 acetylase RimI-like enzyme|nr:acetyltransferase family [Paenibacillaceae bacterium]